MLYNIDSNQELAALLEIVKELPNGIVEVNVNDKIGRYNRIQKTLDFSLRKINDNDIITICNFLNLNPEITGLNLYGTAITDASLPLLIQNKTLKRLDLGKTAVTGHINAKNLDVNVYLEVLNVSYSAITKKGLDNFACIYPQITQLNIAGNHFDNQIIHSIKTFKKLEQLDIHDNALTDIGVKSLVAHQVIHSINFAKNPLTDQCIASLMNSTIRSLNLNHTDISENGAKKLLASKSITALQYPKNKLTDATAKKLNNTLQDNQNRSDKLQKQQAAKAYFTFLTINHTANRHGLPQLPKEITEKIGDFANAAINATLSKPLPPIAKLKTPQIARQHGFFIEKNEDKPEVKKSLNLFKCFTKLVK